MIEPVVTDDICNEIASVFNGILDGTIDWTHNREARIVGPAYVATEIGNAVYHVSEKAKEKQFVTVEELTALTDNLISIAETFEVDELRRPISKLLDIVKRETQKYK